MKMHIHNFLYIEDTFHLSLGSNGAFKLKSLASIVTLNYKLSLSVNLCYLQFSTTVNNNKYLQSFITTLNNMINNSQFGVVDYLYLKGIGFKVFQTSNVLFFKLNYSHYIYYVLPLEMKVSVKKKNKLLKFQYYQDRLARNIINKIHKFRITNIYTQKGIFKKSQLVLKKEGKKKQI